MEKYLQKKNIASISIFVLLIFIVVFQFSASAVFGIEANNNKETEKLENRIDFLNYEKECSKVKDQTEKYFNENKLELETLQKKVNMGWQALDARTNSFNIFLEVILVVIAVFALLGFGGFYLLYEKAKNEWEKIKKIGNDVEKTEEHIKVIAANIEHNATNVEHNAEKIEHNAEEMDVVLKDVKEKVKEKQTKSLGENEEIENEEMMIKNTEEEEKRAEKEEKTNLLRMQAFLEDDVNKKEKLYTKGLKINPEDANINGSYAIFLTQQGNRELDEKKKVEYYQKAEKHYLIAIEGATWNGSYAIFLRQQGGRELDKKKKTEYYQKAEEHYLKALKNEPEDARNNGNYAYLLFNSDNPDKDYQKAERHYLIALKSEPENAIRNGNYANLLSKSDNPYKDYQKAEKHYLIALKSRPENAIRNGNYAKLLFVLGRDDDAEKHWKISFDNCDKENEKDILLKLYFYHYAHTKNDAIRKESKTEIKKLLDKGIKSPGWDLAGNIKKVEEDGTHPDIERVKEFAKEISKTK